MKLKAVEAQPAPGAWKGLIDGLRAQGAAVPGILHLFAYRPGWTDHLARFTQEVMRGASELSPGERELIAASAARRNDCLF